MAESEYLRQTVGEPLARCLADVVLHRPHDPIEYIALWLYKHSANVQNELRVCTESSCKRYFGTVSKIKSHKKPHPVIAFLSTKLGMNLNLWKSEEANTLATKPRMKL